ncbi:glycosyltransferase involved in cell wall biosynthesis [Sporomusaceae bacterium BoRhaA]|uniref:glycosyltransferase family 2 protein n=1 Tax=Pelorhabdus rhamnosifermentans TaxID=2772457 RepID=UPI001C062089|nr:glycosyltransferase family 2 protein [Pelorhabdus rhamnosifermentans]MBU2703225.1 glycosyltransferase involved in cell wall biosynthesis [Pelorhabdus rhamnosifermentans]
MLNQDIAEPNTLQQELIKIREYIKKFDVVDALSMPKVSIIIPTYNRQEMLKDAVESAMAQDYPNLEIIVTDNASIDGTDDMMKSYVKDDRIIYFRHDKNMGPVFNGRNACINIATGKYALLLCDDDYLLDSSYISKAINLILENQSIVLVHANCKWLNLSNGSVQVTNYKEARFIKGNEYFLYYETAEQYPHIVGLVTALFDREKAIHTMAYVDEGAVGGDMVLYLELMLLGNVGILGSCAGFYRFHDGSCSSHLENYVQMDSTIILLEKLKKMALEKQFNPQLLEQWINFRVFTYVRWFVVSCYNQGQHQAGECLLERIKEQYPAIYQAVKRSLNM